MSKATGARDAEPTGAGAASAPPLQDRADDDDYDEDNEEGQDIGLTPNQRRLLYMISLYTKPASSAAEKEEWVRRQALLVLIYEGIVKQVFDYDYAPISTIINDQRTFFNVSQEGSSDIDFLREEGLLNNLKRSSSTYLPVSCYQISARGGDLIRRVGRTDKEAVHEVVYAPGTRDLLQAVWRNRKWYLLAGGYEMESSVTDCEDVSYVGSAYVPQCLRFGGRPTLSNAHRSAECARAASNIRDVLDEIITLNSVSVVIAEYVPFGANNVAQVNSNLGSADRVSGGFFSAVVDDDAGGTRFAVEAGLTSVNVLDYSHTRHVNFEADIYMPEEAGIIQVETLGISVNADGTVFHGMQIEAVMDRIKDNISLDQLSRLLVDVTIDSSTMLDSVISAHQRKLLSIIYSGNATARDKVNLIIANEITPHLTAEEYMDKGDYENELKQVLGETRAAFDISEHDTLIFGSNGLLIAGPNARLHEPLLCSYMQFNAMDLFIRNFFARTFLLNDDMRVLRRAINNYHTDPFATSKINERLQHVSDEVRLMSEILGYLIESLETCEIPAAPADPSGKALYQRLQIADLAAQLSMRVLDLKKLMDGTRAELMHLRHLAKVVTEARQLKLLSDSHVTTMQLVQANSANERTQSTLWMIMLILAGMLAFDILDRLTGSWTVMDSDWMQDFANPMIKKKPLVWLLINMLFWLLVGFVSVRLLSLLVFSTQGVTTLRVRIMQKLILERFYAYLGSKVTSFEERGYDGKNMMVRVTWEDPDPIMRQQYGGTVPRLTAEYDKSTGFMHQLTVEYNRRLAKKADVLTTLELKNMVSDELQKAGVFADKAFNFREDVKTEETTLRLKAKAKKLAPKGKEKDTGKGKDGKKSSSSSGSKSKKVDAGGGGDDGAGAGVSSPSRA